MSAEDKVAFGDEKQGHDVEAVAQVISAGNEEDDIVEFDEKKDLRCVSLAKEPRNTHHVLRRGLHQRHIQMIALAGTIGTVRALHPVWQLDYSV